VRGHLSLKEYAAIGSQLCEVTASTTHERCKPSQPLSAYGVDRIALNFVAQDGGGSGLCAAAGHYDANQWV